ncbi:MAG: TatD family hydrolase [Verrucomicrobia bacterium]|nr:TatD family hydrolase [Verrucomicrobiota bacterium]
MFIDAHAHLTGKEDPGLSSLLARATLAGVKAILNVCCDLDDLVRGLLLASQSSVPKVYTIAAITPHDAAKEMDHFFSRIERESKAKSLVAIGETGLDYHYMHAPKSRQQELLRAHVRLASKERLPVVIHCRDAFDDLFMVLDEESAQLPFSPPVMLHCFTGGIKEAEAAVHRGWYISLSGMVTFPKSLALREVAAFCPLDRLLIETDTPYLAPQGYRGKTNEPAFIVETAKQVAKSKNMSLEELALQTSKNCETLFKL